MPLAQKHIEKRGSAQIKSSLLLAALSTPGITSVLEVKASRNHSEIFLKKINADIKIKKLKKGNLISLKGQKNLYAFNYAVGSDPSSAAFLIALTLLTPGAKSTIPNVICNDKRICDIDLSWPGSTHASRMWNRSEAKVYLETQRRFQSDQRRKRA